MKKTIICIVFCCFVIVLERPFLFAQTIDFNNFTYRLSKDAQDQLGVAGDVKVINGKFSNKEGGFSVDSVLSSDEISAVIVEYGIHEINHPVHDIYIFNVSDRARLVRLFTVKDLAKDYGRWFDPEAVLDVVFNKVNITGNRISIPVYTDGPRCCPKNVAFLIYEVNRGGVSLIGKPTKEHFTSIDKISSGPIGEQKTQNEKKLLENTLVQAKNKASGNGTSNNVAKALADARQSVTGSQSEKNIGTVNGSLDVYRQIVTKVVKLQWRFPQSAAYDSLTSVIAINIDPQGNVLNYELSQSSGNQKFDAAALNAVVNTGTLPAPPPGLRVVHLIFNSKELNPQRSQFGEDHLVGKWKWFTGEIHTFLPNGSINTSPRFLPNSFWRCEDAKFRKYTIVWMGGKFVDRVSISPDGLNIVGVNQYRARITGTRIN
jgi:TonB family protein